MFLDGYLFFGAILKFSGRKKRKTTSSQEGTNQSMAVLLFEILSCNNRAIFISPDFNMMFNIDIKMIL